MTNNTVHIDLHKSQHVAGDVVTGQVTLTVQEPVAAVKLVASFKGDTRSLVRYGKKSFHSHERLFEDKIILKEYNGAIVPVGTFVFPFSYQLANNLPGVFYAKEGFNSGLIKYTMKVYLDTTANDTGVIAKFSNLFTEKRNAESQVDLIINPRGCIESRPICVDTTRTFTFASGKIYLKAELDTDVFTTTDQICVRVHVNNDCSSHIRQLKVKLMQDLKFHATHTYSRTHEVQRQVFEGVQPHTEVTRDLILELKEQKNVHPSTVSRLVSCTYHLDIECDLSLSSDVELHPVITLVYNPETTEQSFNLYSGYDKSVWTNCNNLDDDGVPTEVIEH
jgi:hypothetical protein